MQTNEFEQMQKEEINEFEQMQKEEINEFEQMQNNERNENNDLEQMQNKETKKPRVKNIDPETGLPVKRAYNKKPKKEEGETEKGETEKGETEKKKPKKKTKSEAEPPVIPNLSTTELPEVQVAEGEPEEVPRFSLHLPPDSPVPTRVILTPRDSKTKNEPPAAPKKRKPKAKKTEGVEEPLPSLPQEDVLLEDMTNQLARMDLQDNNPVKKVVKRQAKQKTLAPTPAPAPTPIQDVPSSLPDYSQIDDFEPVSPKSEGLHNLGYFLPFLQKWPHQKFVCLVHNVKGYDELRFVRFTEKYDPLLKGFPCEFVQSIVVERRQRRYVIPFWGNVVKEGFLADKYLFNLTPYDENEDYIIVDSSV